MDVMENVVQLIRKIAPAAAEIGEQTNMFTDLGLDSLTYMVLLRGIEEEYGFEFSIIEMEPCLVVGTLVETVKQRLRLRGGMIRNALLNRDIWGKTAIFDGDADVTYGEIARKAMAVRAALNARTGAHVAVLLPNGVDFIAALHGIMIAGRTAFPLSATLTRREVESMLEQGDASTVITCKGFTPLFDQMDSRPDIIYMDDVSPIDDGDEPAPVETDPDPDSPLILLATSGTTGKAKIVMLSERNIASCVSDYLDITNLDALGVDIRYVLSLPFSSAYGIFILSVIAHKGFAIAMTAEPFTLDAFYRAVERYRIMNYHGGAMAVTLMAENIGRPIPYDISSLRYCSFGGSGVTRETLVRLTRAFDGVEFWMGYGLTEAGPVITQARKPMPEDKLGSAGIAGKHVTLMIESDGVKTQAPFVRGEVVVKGPNVMLGYYKNEAETARMIRDGWLHTGDIGYLDDSGYLYLCGRMRNIILSRGFTVYPEEVEECVMSSGLAESCVVYGRPDNFGSEQVCADVVPKDPVTSVEDVMVWCASRLADYKQPRYVRMTDTVVKTATGKIARV
ncbi:MAG: AMP-binding protein [Oscillospiraceae bacterium]|jgi:long-chain acyl-CoA synthetase|nr:AMP-binding protein [Oscillospiraceae bacterium]